MAFWYYNNTGTYHVDLSNSDMGLDVYLCGSGPSLNNVNNKDLHCDGSFVVGVNNSYPKIKPHMWIGLDDPSCFHHKIWSDPCMKILRGGYQDRTYHGISIKNNHNLFYEDCKEYEDFEKESMFYNKPDRTMFYWDKTVIGTTLHILLHMGAKRIHLVGADLDNSKKQYWNNIKRDKKVFTRNKNTYKQIIEHYKWFRKIGLKYDVELISCTPNSPVNDFLKYIPLKEALKDTRKRRTFKKKKMLTGVDAEKIFKGDDEVQKRK